MGLSAQEAKSFDGQSYPSGKMGVEAVLPKVMDPASFGLKCVNSMEDFFSSMALLSRAVQNLSASTALRLGLLIKNQKREVRRKYA